MGAGSSVVVHAPVRVADVGGWTDTWFGAPGLVCHLPVEPGVEVSARLVERTPETPLVRIVAPSVGVDLALGPNPAVPERHPILRHSVASVLDPDPGLIPDGAAVHLHIDSGIPHGASMGTSAAVEVALLRALDLLLAGGTRSPLDLALQAHQVETVRCGLEAGVQDQWAAAFAQPALLEIGPFERAGATPAVIHRPLALAAATREHLDACLVTVVLGAHDSSAVHRRVIDDLLTSGHGIDGGRAILSHLADLARAAAAALRAGDLTGWGGILAANTDAQAALNAHLVGPGHHHAIDLARRHGALGWKVNGAGGSGGSLTALAPDPPAAARLADAWRSQDPTWVVPTLRIASSNQRPSPTARR